jgi:hypothetical protein
VAFREQTTIEPVSMGAELLAEKVNDFAECNCVATAPECPAPQQGATRLIAEF